MFAQVKLNLKTIAILTLAVGLVAFGKFFAVVIPSAFSIASGTFDMLTYAQIQLNVSWSQWITPIVGASILAFLLIRSRGQINRKLTKLQAVKFLTFFTITAFLLCMVSSPLAECGTIATSGYILDTPFSQFDFYVGQYSNGNFFAINGSSWDNLMGGVGSSAWAAYTSNLTKVEELALAATSNGTIYLSGCKFAYSLTIPSNVAVIENVAGLQRTFINSANSQNSVYTISQDTNSGYYIVQDSANRIINSLSSTNGYTTIQNTINTGSNIFFKNGTYTYNTYLTVSSSNQHIYGEKGATLKAAASFTGTRMLWILGNKTEISDLKIDGSSVVASGIEFYNSSYGKAINNEVFNTQDTGIVAYGWDALTHGNKFLDNYIHDITGGTAVGQGISLAYGGASGKGGYDNLIEGNTVEDVEEHGIKSYDRFQGTTITNNFIRNTGNTGISIYENSICSFNHIYNTTSRAIYSAGINTIIEGNNINYTKSYGIDIEANNCVVSNNKVYGIVDPGLSAYKIAGNYTTITGNSISGDLTHPAYGIYLSSTAFYNTITSNEMSGAYRAIYEDGGNYNSITNCNARSIGAAGIWVSGTSTTISNSWNYTAHIGYWNGTYLVYA